MGLNAIYIWAALLIVISIYLIHVARPLRRRHVWSSFANRITTGMGLGMTIFGLLSIFLLFTTLANGSFQFLSEMGVSHILFGTNWNPPKGNEPEIAEKLGFLPLSVNTILVAFISGGISIFIGRAIGIQAGSMKGRKKFFLLLFLYVFLMIPSVTWAFMGSIYLQPFLGKLFGLFNDKTVLSTAMTISGLNIPVVAILTNAAIGNIPSHIWENARINQADAATRWKWYLKPEINATLFVTSLVVVLRGAAETTVASRLMGGPQDLSQSPFWTWPLQSGSTLSKVASEYLRPESPDHPMNAPGGADFALASIFINMAIVVIGITLIRYFAQKKQENRSMISIPKKTSELKKKLFQAWLKGSTILSLLLVTFVFGALVHIGGHMTQVTEIRYHGICPDDGEYGKAEIRSFLSTQLGIEKPSRTERRELTKIYGFTVQKGIVCSPGEQIDAWLTPSTQTDGYIKARNPLIAILFETRNFAPAAVQKEWIEILMKKKLDLEDPRIIRVKWNSTIFSSTKFFSDPFKNGFRASFFSSLLNAFVAVFAVVAALLGAVFIRFFMKSTYRVPVSTVFALSLSIPALGYGYMGKINFISILGLPNAVNITLYMTTFMVVFMVSIVNFTSRLQDVPESDLDTGRSHAFLRLETIVKYILSRDMQGVYLIGALAMTAGLQETSQWFPVGGLNLSLSEPSLAPLGEARPLNAVAYGLRALSNPAFESIEALLNLALIATILPFAVAAALLEKK